MKTPLISIITPLHNKCATVERTVRSVLAQSVTDWEMIVIENHSTDDGPDRVKKFDDPRITLIVTDKKGPGTARNVGLQAARGTWVHFLDADDEIDPDYFEIMIQTALANPDTGIIASSWVELQEGHPPLIKQAPGSNGNREALLAYSIAFGAWPPHAAIVKRALLTSEFQWEEALDRWLAEDVPFWFKLFHQTSVIFAPIAGARYYLAPEGSRSTSGGIERWFHGCHTAVQSSLRFLSQRSIPISPSQAAHLMRQYEDLYSKALQADRMEFAQIAEVEWNHWMNEVALGPSLSRSGYWLRKILGLKYFQALSRQLKTFRT